MPSKECKSSVARVLSLSTAHGIGHAATSRPTPLKVMWLLLFLLFFVLFFNSFAQLVIKFWNRTPTKSVELDKVPFVFPDLYFCPSDPYSGSIPYNLTQDEADLINSEITRLIDLCCKKTICDGSLKSPSILAVFSWTQMLSKSLPVSLAIKYLAQRREQSVPYVKMEPGEQFLKLETFSHPQNLLCFKVALTDYQRENLMSKGTAVRMVLSTDPFFPDFTYPGFSVMDLNVTTGLSRKFRDWSTQYPAGILRSSGYKLLVVPPGSYPLMDHEHTVHLAPGNAYELKLRMEENIYSEQLKDTHCIPNHPKVAMRDYMTHEKVDFEYSYGYCYLYELSKFSTDKIGAQMLSLPTPWEFSKFPRAYNVSEMTKQLDKNVRVNDASLPRYFAKEERRIARYCRLRQPCKFSQYSSSSSFTKWPSAGTVAEDVIYPLELGSAGIGAKLPAVPAIAKLWELAKLVKSGSYSAQNESVLRSYVSESLLNVRISAETAMVPLVTTDMSYTVTSFLADTGGLLGLFVGCSLLTVFELVDLLWAVCVGCGTCGRRDRRQQSGSVDREKMADETEAAL